MMKKVLLGTLLLISFNGWSSSVYRGLVAQIVCHADSVTSTCMVQLKSTPSGESCSANNDWKYAFNGSTPEGSNLLSLLLTAQVSRKTVGIRGQGQCTLVNYSEDISYVSIEE
ncbi:hypothetical protein N480_20990 [Pseudoalteromonas luteoviolacea S2607]|uniref:hypothetical protein n=1 Tax=Pseudoalteromonas luteoviolacea TaxID=43657 RepID=UPI0007B085C3|nr:hypothetical protein [Pseudoalteromonas luteoviolacea]KZN34762.1 hypothetical protein N480_20990 [Pseudoalteromonas luteoviolacea S2607]